MLDDLVCPSCDVLLPDGTDICNKCGREVRPAETGHPFIDTPRKVYYHLVPNLGHVWANIVAGFVCLVLLGFILFRVFMELAPRG